MSAAETPHTGVRSMLPGFYPPRAGELKRFISEGLVVLDTNGCWPTSTATSSPHGACLWCGRALPPARSDGPAGTAATTTASTAARRGSGTPSGSVAPAATRTAHRRHPPLWTRSRCRILARPGLPCAHLADRSVPLPVNRWADMSNGARTNPTLATLRGGPMTQTAASDGDTARPECRPVTSPEGRVDR